MIKNLELFHIEDLLYFRVCVKVLQSRYFLLKLLQREMAATFFYNPVTQIVL